MMATMNIPDDMPFEYKSMTKSIQKAQGGLEAQHFEIRKNVLKYDEVMNKQRQVMYAERRRVLEGEDLHEKIDNFIDDVISDHITSFTSEGAPEEWDLDALWADLRIIYPIEIEADEIIELVGRIGSLTPKVLTREILSDAHVVYKEREELIGAENMRDLERRVVLSVLDRKWREHLYEMDYLKEGIGLRAMAQRDPLVEYSIEGSRMFDAMNYAIKEEAISFLFNVKFEIVNEVQTPEEQSQEGLSYSAPAENVGGSEFSDVPTGEEGAGGSAGGGSAGGVGASRAERRAAAGGGSGSSGAQKSQRSANEKSMRGEASRPEADGRAFPGTKPNDPCPCGSGKKYKLCHGKNDKDLPAASQGAKSPSKQPLGRPFKQTSKQSAKQTNKSANSKNPSQKGKKKK
jgi:preprotein translocase subunit SecA